MKMQNKKRGFTIVELVIVIAVIAILAGVLVPTFTGIVKKAKASAALQEATSAYHTLLTEQGENIGELEDEDNVDLYIVVDNAYFFAVEGGALTAVNAKPDGYEIEVELEEEIAGVQFFQYGTANP